MQGLARLRQQRDDLFLRHIVPQSISPRHNHITRLHARLFKILNTEQSWPTLRPLRWSVSIQLPRQSTWCRTASLQ